MPLLPIAGSSKALSYIKAGSATGYAGYHMTAAGSNFTQAQPSSTTLSLYFTHRVGARSSAPRMARYIATPLVPPAAAAPPAVP